MQVVYADSFLCFNALADYLLLHLTAAFAGLRVRRKRLILAALLGAVYALSALVWRGLWLLPPMKLLISFFMVRLAFGKAPLLLRRWLFFLLVSAAFSGFTVMLRNFAGAEGVPFSFAVFAVTAVFAYALLSFSFRGSGEAILRREIIRTQISLEGKTLTLHTLLDSGCSLKDKDGKRVLIAEKSALAELPYEPTEQVRFESLGGGGELKAFYAAVQLGKQPPEERLVALAPENVRFADGYRAIIGKE